MSASTAQAQGLVSILEATSQVIAGFATPLTLSSWPLYVFEVVSIVYSSAVDTGADRKALVAAILENLVDSSTVLTADEKTELKSIIAQTTSAAVDALLKANSVVDTWVEQEARTCWTRFRAWCQKHCSFKCCSDDATREPVPIAPLVSGTVDNSSVVESEPAPVEPAPVEPAPVEPAPVEPAPVEPAPVEPAPVEPAPVELAPVELAPVELAPVVQTADTVALLTEPETAPIADVQQTAESVPVLVEAVPESRVVVQSAERSGELEAQTDIVPLASDPIPIPAAAAESFTSSTDATTQAASGL